MPTPTRDLIDDAADMLGKTRTAFIIDSCRKQADDVLLDKRLFTLDANQYEAFLSALNETPKPNEKLKRLFAGKSPWDK